jgi:two-component system LytT family sensor kinase
VPTPGRRRSRDERWLPRVERSPPDGPPARGYAGRSSYEEKEDHSAAVDVVLGVVVGWAIVASVAALLRLLRPRPVLSGEGAAMQSALHAATVMLPDLRRGLSAESAGRAAPHLRRLTQTPSIALTDRAGVLAFSGLASEHHRAGDQLFGLIAEGRDDRVHVEPRFTCPHAGCPLSAAIVAPLIVQRQRVGSLVAFSTSARDLGPEQTRVLVEAASLVSAQIELSALEAQGERLARAELQALRAQISPHFLYNALAAVASFIHTQPDEARELLSEFAEFTRYAFRRQTPFVTLADELRYVEKYLRLEQARFGERLEIRLDVAPEVLPAVLPVLSLQPLVENAVRHGVERRGHGRVEIVGRDLGAEVELRVTDDGVGMDAEAGAAAVEGRGSGIGLANVQARIQTTFGAEYGLTVQSRVGHGTTVTMTLPRSRPGVRAA